MLGDLVFLALGIMAGTTFFALLRWNTLLYVQGGSLGFALGLQAVRIGLLGGLLVLTALQGALPLLLTALGLLIARPIVMRCIMGGVA